MSNNRSSETLPRINAKLVTTLLGLVAVVLLGFYLYQNREVFTSLRNITISQIAIILGIETANFLLGSALNYSMVRRFGYHVSYFDSVILQYINSFLNKILPTIGGGAAFRAVFLKKKYQLPYSQFAATLGGFYLISFIATAGIGLASMAWIYQRYGVTNWIIIIAFSALIVPSLIVVFFSPRIPEKKNRILNSLSRAVDGWNLLKKDKGYIAFYTAVIVLQLLLSSWQMFFAFKAIGIQTSYIQVLFLSSLGIILSFLNFTPDGIGIREVVYAFSASIVQISQASVVLGSLVLRALSIITSLIVGGVGYWVFLRQIKEIEEMQNEKPATPRLTGELEIVEPTPQDVHPIN